MLGLFAGWLWLMMVWLGRSSPWVVEFSGGFGYFAVGVTICEMGFSCGYGYFLVMGLGVWSWL